MRHLLVVLTVLPLAAASAPRVRAADFPTRCAAPGVIKCVGFDQASDIAGTWGDNHGAWGGAKRCSVNTAVACSSNADCSGLTPSGQTCVTSPVLDTTIKASGSSSLKFTFPSNSGSGAAGQYFTNFSADLATQFGENSDFYVQWRQRFSTEYMNTNMASTSGQGIKQIIIGSGDKAGCNSTTGNHCSNNAGISCSDDSPCLPNGTCDIVCASSCSYLEVVVQDTYKRGYPQMYNSCFGSTSHGAYDPWQEPYGGSDYKNQNAMPSPYCLNYDPSGTNCVRYYPNEWLTYQVHIHTGPRRTTANYDEWSNSHVDLWIAREGQPSVKVMDWVVGSRTYALSAGPLASDLKFGKVWLLPYITDKDASQIHTPVSIWYDELIISTQKIADPDSSGATQPPAAPANVRVK